MKIANPSHGPVDLDLSVDGPTATATTPTAARPPLLWALAGAGVALVLGFAAAAQLQSRAPEASPATASRTGPRPQPSHLARSADPANPPQAATQPVCQACGVVESVEAVKVRGEANGTGAVIGGVVGGVLGHEIGGNTTGTVIGAVGGGIAGHQIEKHVRSHTVFRVRVRMDDGSQRSFTEAQARAVGSRVKVEKGRLTSAPATPNQAV